MSTRFLIDLAERSVTTFLEAFLALWLVVGDTQADRLFTWANTKVALIAGAIAVGKGLLASLRGRKDSASLAGSV